MAKRITLNNLKSQANKTFTQKKITIDDYEFYIDEQFRPTKISELIDEYMAKLQYAEDKGVELSGVIIEYALILKYFTSIKVPDELEKQVDLIDVLVDLGYLETILNSFEESEAQKIAETMKKGADNAQEMIEKLSQMQEAGDK